MLTQWNANEQTGLRSICGGRARKSCRQISSHFFFVTKLSETQKIDLNLIKKIWWFLIFFLSIFHFRRNKKRFFLISTFGLSSLRHTHSKSNESRATKINWKHPRQPDGASEKCHVQLNRFHRRPAFLHPHRGQLISISVCGPDWRFDVRGNQNKVEANFQFTYDIDFHVQLVRLLFVLLVARARLWRWWKIQVPVTWRRRLKRALRQRETSMFSGWRLFSWVSGRLRLTTFVTRSWCFFTLLQMTASICRLVACLIEWKEKENVFVDD